MEIKINDKLLNVNVVAIEKNIIKIDVEGRFYELDVEMVERGVYSIISNNRSFNVELIRGESARNYTVNTQRNTFDIEIIDAQARYLTNRNKQQGLAGENTIVSPMPGRIVRILVKEGDTVKAGQPLIVVSAMKMESESKSGIDGVVKKILVKDGQTIEGKQVLITIE